MHVPLVVEYYPASPDSIAQAASQTADRIGALSALEGSFRSRHRDVVSTVSGGISTSVLGIGRFPEQSMAAIRQSGIWASGCLMEFAAAVRSFNTAHSSPRCVRKLLQAYEEAAGHNFGVPVEAVSVPGEPTTIDRGADDSYQEKVAAARDELVRELNAEYHRLEAWLDGEATRVSQMLTSGPTDAEVRRMWGAGLLPPYTPLYFPGLDLPGEDIARLRFGDPSWRLEDNLAGSLGDDAPCTYGWVRGPDGEWYAIVVPTWSTSDGDCSTKHCLANPEGEGTGVPYQDGWETIHSRMGEIAVGDAPGLDDAFAFAITGVQPYGPQSMGDDQTRYVVMDPETGRVDLVDGTESRGEPYGPADGGLDNPYHPSQQAGVDRIDRYGGVLDLGIQLGEAGTSMQTVEDARHHAYQVVFQQGDNGERRAVILLNQGQYDDQGEPRVRQRFGMVNRNDELEPVD